ncbi:efflux RND transporter periplasmic adaptor subunit [Chitinophaga nivalis]|uniref:Efflux RND transporter periplasmic adaptor subunit n=1 Tax=Chitinophaga nivalis TaxID=2991709 RepID=A0ABT3IVV7_9BACT|nr:efflux RND transporter periplasmic adaptor subunit [Chitinophaga nivalis]MCW3462196.1 efflux RND transporter periplasmic adaptor subunit [Chitinophaga nivalis]MCW3488112.1 efflux RND transporter periplasmic adaptor subunit [Chitinophaga nivalis]
MDRKIEKKFWNKKRILMIGGGAVVALLLIYALIFADHRATLNVEKDKITISPVKKGTFDVYIAVTAVVMPLKTIRLDAIEAGYVSRKYLEGGSMVKQGDSILKLDNQHMVMQFVTQETEIYRLRNDLQNTRLNIRKEDFLEQQAISELNARIDAAQDLYDRNKQLVDEKIVARQEFNKNKFDLEGLLKQRAIKLESQEYQRENAKMQIAQLEGTLARTQRNLDLMKENLNSLIVRAPVSGQLSSIDVEIGSSITAGQNIGQIDDLNGFKLRADIDEHYVSQVFAGLKASFEFDGKSYAMVITKVYPEVKNGRFQADMTFEKETPAGIRRGQSTPIRLVLGKSAEALLLPLGGFFSDTGGNWVYVVDKNGKQAVKRNISLGRKNPLYFEILEGLQPGDQVITSSYENFGNKDVLAF